MNSCEELSDTSCCWPEICLPIADDVKPPPNEGVALKAFPVLLASQIAACFNQFGQQHSIGDFAVPCCSPLAGARHDRHFVLIKINLALLRWCVVNNWPALNHEPEALVNNIQSLSPGHLGWLAELTIRTIQLPQSDLTKRLLDLAPTSRSHDAPDKHHSSLLLTLLQLGIVDQPVLLHQKTAKRQLWRSAFAKPIHLVQSRLMSDYFGASVGFYFAWMSSYAVLLLIPALIGLLAWLVNQLGAQMLPPLVKLLLRLSFSLARILWALAATKLWARLYAEWHARETSQCRLLSSIGGDLSWLLEAGVDQRPGYKGDWRKSRVTGRPELHDKASKRRLRLMVSAGASTVCLLVAILVNILLLNWEGFILPTKSPWIYIACISRTTEPGALFDAQGDGWLAYLPGVAHSLLVFVMNQLIFRRLAEQLTEYENHPTFEAHDRSLVVKRFLFELVDAYACFAYLGLVLGDHAAVKSLLLTMLCTDSLRRITLECIIPMVLYHSRQMTNKARIGLVKRRGDDSTPSVVDDLDDDNQLIDPTRIKVIDGELAMDPYEQFDDYLEMILQHGYLVLFAFVCPPVGALIALASTLVEIYSDAFKLLAITQRPFARLLIRPSNIWLQLLASQAWLSILTNATLFSVKWAELDDDGAWATDSDQLPDPIGLFLVIEHLLVLIGLLIHFGISDVPSRVRDDRRARDYARAMNLVH